MESITKNMGDFKSAFSQLLYSSDISSKRNLVFMDAIRLLVNEDDRAKRVAIASQYYQFAREIGKERTQ